MAWRSLKSLFVCAVLLLTGRLHAQEYTRCWLNSIVGFEKAHQRAAMTLNGTTQNDLAQLQVYVTAKKFPESPNAQLYIHTNFKPLGQKNALKLAFPESSLKQFYGAEPQELTALLAAVLEQEGVAGAGQKIANSATMYFDAECYRYFPKLQTGDASKVLTVAASGKSMPQIEMLAANGLVRRFARVSPPPPTARLFVAESLAATPEKFTALADLPFAQADTVLVSVVKDEATEAILRGIPEAQRVLKSDFTKDQFFAALKARKGKMQFIMAHIQNGEIVLSPDGSIRVPIKEVEEFAARESLSIGIIGCESGVNQKGLVASKYINSTLAAKQYAGASGAKNYLEFFQQLSCDQLQVVINESTIEAVAEHKRAVAKGHLYSSNVLVNGQRVVKEQGVISITAESKP